MSPMSVQKKTGTSVDPNIYLGYHEFSHRDDINDI